MASSAKTLNILLEGTPRDCSLQEIRAGMEGVEGVINVHDLHVWSLGSQSSALACHVTIADIPPSESNCILVKLNHVLREHFHITHTTSSSSTKTARSSMAALSPSRSLAGEAGGHEHHHHGHAH